MNLKEKIENNPVVWLGGTLLAGFLSGLTAYSGIMKIAKLESVTSSKLVQYESAQAELEATKIELETAKTKLNDQSSINYIPSNDIDIELRRYVELSGIRAGVETMKDHIKTKYRDQHDLDEQEIACIIDSSFHGHEYIDVIVEISKKHMTLAEVQEFNTFYSRDELQIFREKQTIIVQDFIKKIDDVSESKYETFKRLTKRPENGNKLDSNRCPIE